MVGPACRQQDSFSRFSSHTESRPGRDESRARPASPEAGRYPDHSLVVFHPIHSGVSTPDQAAGSPNRGPDHAPSPRASADHPIPCVAGSPPSLGAKSPRAVWRLPSRPLLGSDRIRVSPRNATPPRMPARSGRAGMRRRPGRTTLPSTSRGVGHSGRAAASRRRASPPGWDRTRDWSGSSRA